MSGILGHFPGGGGKNTGLYIWGRYKVTTLYSEQNTTSQKTTIPDIGALQQTIQLYTGSSYTFDAATGLFTIVNPTIIDVAYGSSYTFSGAQYFTINSPTSDMMFKSYGSSISSRNTSVYNNNNSVYVKAGGSNYKFTQYSQAPYQQISFLDYAVSDNENKYPDGEIHTDGYKYEKIPKVNAGAYSWRKLTAQGGDFIEYVTDDDVNAYPKSGEQEGYWYERVPTIAAGSYTPSSGLNSYVLISTPFKTPPLHYGISSVTVDANSDISVTLYKYSNVDYYYLRVAASGSGDFIEKGTIGWVAVGY